MASGDRLASLAGSLGCGDAPQRAGGQPPASRPRTTTTRWAPSAASPTDGFNPDAFLRSWNFSDLPPDERAKFYRETPRPDGTLLREYEIFAVDREIEIAPGMFFPAWTYNGQVPGPTIRATEGDRVRSRSGTSASHPHTIHFHGWHPPAMDGALPGQEVQPGDTFVYEFDADPFGLHLYHCHTVPLKRHIHKGLYGAFIIDPRGGRAAGRRDGDGDERVRHELRRRERGLRGQHGRQRLHARPDSRHGRAAWCASIWSTSPSSI